VIDECLTDPELCEALDEAGVRTPKAAVHWAIEHEGLHLGHATETRWGGDDDDDSEIATEKHFKAMVREILAENNRDARNCDLSLM
jgi:hypothetical protein